MNSTHETEAKRYIAPMLIGEAERAELAMQAKVEFYKNNKRAFHIYGKMGNMKKMKPIGGQRFVTNLIYADIFSVESIEDESKLLKELSFLKTQGDFELREIKNYF